MYEVFSNNRVIIFTQSVGQLTNDLQDSYIMKANPDKPLSNLEYLLEKAPYPVMVVETDDPEKLQRRIFADYYKVDAAGGVVQDSRGRLLVIFRRGRWDLPKGKIDAHESVSECAVREVYEETGIQPVITGNTPYSTFHIYKEVGRKVIKHTRWFTMRSDGSSNPEPETSEGIEQVLWATKPFLKQTFLPATYPLIRAVIGHFNLM